MYTYENFKRDGYTGPYLLFSPEEAKQALDLNTQFPDSMLPWQKGRHTVVRSMAKLARHPAIMYRLKKVLGEDILLWGSRIVKLEPGKKFNWRVDREHKEWESVSVWIALENVQPGKSVSLISGSHLLNEDPSRYLLQGVDTTSSVEMLKIARSKFANTNLIDLNIKDGEFFLLNGKTWHCMRNTTEDTQYGILLQYCKTNQKVRAMQDISYKGIKWHSFEPECLLVSGTDEFKRNKVIDLNESGTIKRKVISSVWYAPQNLLYKTRASLMGIF